MDVDAYELDVAYNTFDEIKFKMNVKEGVSNISNFKVDGNEADSDGYWIMNESKKDVEISYDFELDNGKVINRKYYEDIELVGIYSGWSDDEETLNYFKESFNVIISGYFNINSDIFI